MSVSITYFVHGTTTDNEKDLSTGWAGGELSPLGIRQSKELAAMIKDARFDVIFCSDLKRAVDSAHLTFGGTHQIIIEDERLREVNYGDYTQKPAQNFKSDMTKYIDTAFPDGESYRDVEKRIRDFMESLKKNYDGRRVAIVSHEAPQLALDVIVKDKTWEQAIAENWRHTTSWQPGWEYILS